MTTSELLESCIGKDVALKLVGKSIKGTVYGKLSKSLMTGEYVVSSYYNEDFSFPRSSVNNVFAWTVRATIEISL